VTPPTLSRGDVVLTRFPFTDLTGASLPPAVIISQGQIGQDVVLAAISSGVRGALAPTDYTVEVTHPEFALTGLRVTSVLRVHK
jgi:mRNA interferase MazF